MNTALVHEFPEAWGVESLTRNSAEICASAMALVVAFDDSGRCYASAYGGPLNELELAFPALNAVLLKAEVLEVSAENEALRTQDKLVFTKCPNISYFAGLALIGASGEKMGMLCVLDPNPTRLTPSQTLALETIANALAVQLELRKPFTAKADKAATKLLGSSDALLKTQDVVSASESNYRIIFRNSTVAFFIASLDGICEDVNSSFCELVGRERHELIGKEIGVVLFEQDKEVMAYLQSEVLAGRSRNLVRDIKIRRPDRQSKWGRASVAAIYNSVGQPIQTMNLVQDFTLQKKAKQERDQVFEQSFDMFAIIEYDGVIFQTNPAISRNFGIPGKQLLGLNIVDFAHPDDLAKIFSVLQEMKDEASDLPALDIRMKFKDEQYHNIRWTGTRHADQDKLIVVGRDVTHSVTTKSALQRLASRLQQVREEERTRISREIHDELGQILTALKIDLDLLDRDIGHKPNEQLKESIYSIIALVNSTLTSVKRIAQDLRPEVLDALGLVPALEWQAKDTQARTGLDCEIVCKQDIPDLDSEQTTQLFRIIQESLTNVVRHANASYVKVIIDVDEDKNLTINICDNGKGFYVGDLEFHSLGLLGMQERARNIAAKLKIESQKNVGTTVSLTLPTMATYWEE